MKQYRGEVKHMEKETHIYLATKIHERLAVSFTGMIPLGIFQEANIRPDRTRQSIVHPHFADWSLEYIEKQAFFLLEERFGLGDKLQTDFIIRLGLITHYLCDFFCHVHVDNILLRVREHIEYENSLNLAVLNQRGRFDKVCGSVSLLAGCSAGWLRRLHCRYLHDYRQKPAGFERDMKAAACIAVQAAGSIMNHCLKGARPVSAGSGNFQCL
jgi:hypothetical protein